jgi:hypothetical protein
MRITSRYLLQILQTTVRQALRCLTQMHISSNRAQHFY